MQISNQPHKGETYQGISLYKNGKHIGYHNGHKLTKKISYYVKSYIEMFWDELVETCKVNNVEIKLIDKTF